MATLDADDLAAIANLIATTVGLSNLVQIDGLTTTDGAATLKLRRFIVRNSTGDAVIMESTGSGGYGLTINGIDRGAVIGASNGVGLDIFGGSFGHGVQITGGGADETFGVSITSGAVNGGAVYFSGTGTAPVFKIDGSETGPAILIHGPYIGGDSVVITSSSGNAITAKVNFGDGDGFHGEGSGTGAGFFSTPDASGFQSGGSLGTVDANLISIDGLTTNDGAAILNLKKLAIINDGFAPSLQITSAGTAIDVHSTNTGSGLSIRGSGSLPGLKCKGGDDMGSGAEFVSGTSGSGITILGSDRYALQIYANNSPAVNIEADNSDALSITAYSEGFHDIALLGSGDIAGTINLNLTQSLTDVKTATVGGALTGAHTIAWEKMIKDVSGKLLKLFSFGSSSVAKQTFDLNDGNNPTTRTPQ